MTDRSALGDRMKEYERAEAGRRHLRGLPICARLDGKSFSRFTRGLARPFDLRLSQLMMDTTAYLVRETQAAIGYTQSDEISLIYYSESPKSQVFLDGRVQKMTSVLAAMATAYFLRELPKRIPEKASEMPLFDCRTWIVPSREEAVNCLIWRERDATKNSISMAARHYYSHEDLMGLSSSVLQERLFAKGVNWNEYPQFFKRGTYIQRRGVSRRFSAEELALLPEKHRAHHEPDLRVERVVVQPLELPPLTKVVNRVQVVFDAADPELAS